MGCIKIGFVECAENGNQDLYEVYRGGTVKESIRWAIKWSPGIMWDNCLPLLFRTHRECRKRIQSEYGYIKTRKDLREPPFNWRMPTAVKVEVILKESRRE